MNQLSVYVSFFSLAILTLQQVYAQPQTVVNAGLTEQTREERIRELEAENSRLQQEVIRLRNLSLQSQASIRLREQVIERYAQQTDSMTSAQLNLLEQHKRLISAVQTLQSTASTSTRQRNLSDALTAIGLSMASSNATTTTESLTDALTAYSNNLNSSSNSYLKEIRALNTQRENRQAQQRIEFLLLNLSNSLNQIHLKNRN